MEAVEREEAGDREEENPEDGMLYDAEGGGNARAAFPLLSAVEGAKGVEGVFVEGRALLDSAVLRAAARISESF